MRPCNLHLPNAHLLRASGCSWRLAEGGIPALRKRYYIIFVAREDDGSLRKVPVPLHYAYVFVAATVVGLFTITGMAGSYGRMLLKTAHFNQVRSEKEALRHDYLHMQQVAKEKDVQVASLGSLASQVTALYGLRQGHITKASAASVAAPALLDTASESGQYLNTLDQLASLRNSALSGHMRRALETTFASSDAAAWGSAEDAPTLWPVEGPITSSFGERQDPINGEGAFHKGIDISAELGQAVRAPADGTVLMAGPAGGYGREVLIDHGRGIETVYGHLSGFAVTAGQDVRRGEIIGYVGNAGRSTGPHLHYEVRLHNTPVNPHKYMRQTIEEFAQNRPASMGNSMGMF
jgi:murein DD-endopeptidase MepM/ murein hydrolase activator NlpD